MQSGRKCVGAGQPRTTKELNCRNKNWQKLATSVGIVSADVLIYSVEMTRGWGLVGVIIVWDKWV